MGMSRAWLERRQRKACLLCDCVISRAKWILKRKRWESAIKQMWWGRWGQKWAVTETAVSQSNDRSREMKDSRGLNPERHQLKKIIDKCQLCVSEGGRISETNFCINIKKCGLTDELHRLQGHWKQTITTRYSQRETKCFSTCDHTHQLH